MDLETYYESHITDAATAVGSIKSGDRVVVGHACGEPSYLLEAMVANASAYENVEIVHMVAMGRAGYCAPEMAPHFRHNALFVLPLSRAVPSASGPGPSLRSPIPTSGTL